MGTLTNSDSRHVTLSEIVADVLRQAICDGTYVCGDRLVELTIAHEMNVSQNTARDALRILEREGWVVKRPRYGVYVRDFSATEVDEIYLLRGALEPLMIEWAFANGLSSHTEQMREFYDEARNFADLGNLRGMRRSLAAIHESWLSIGDHPRTAEILTHLHNQCCLLEATLDIYHEPDSCPQQVLSHYDTLTTVITEGDKSGTLTTLKTILSTEHQWMQTHFQQYSAQVDNEGDGE